MSKSVNDVENYWSEELGESVDIVPVGWHDYPSEYRLLIGGTDVVSFKHLSEIEDFLDVYFVKSGPA